jgi:hypothetical protein
MVYTLVLEASAARIESSSLSLRTKHNMITLTITWASTDDLFAAGVDYARMDLLTEMIRAGQTDGVSVQVSDLITTRQFVDMNAVDHFIDGLVTSCNASNVTPPTFSRQ